MRKPVFLLAIILLLCVFAFSAWKLWTYFSESAETQSDYDALSQLPGFSNELYGNMVVTPQLYQQAILVGQMQQQQQQAMEQMKAQYAAQQDAINRQTPRRRRRRLPEGPARSIHQLRTAAESDE